MLEGNASAAHKPAGLQPGLVLGGRFEVMERVREDAIAVTWSAQDQQSQRKIELRLMRPGLLPQAATGEFREACRIAASLSHRGIARLFGVGRTPSGEQFLAGEWTEGRPLNTFIADRTENGEPLSLRGAYNVVAHVCSALLYAQDQTVHGTLRPGAVIVTRGGRVKLRDMATGLVLLQSVGPEVFKDADHASLAPEVKRGELATAQSDVFGLGAILYLLLTTRLPSDELVPPSQVRDDVPAEVDEIVRKCLAPEPSARYESPEDVRAALLPHLTQANSMPPPKHTPAISFDIDLASVLPPAEMKIPSVQPPPPPPSPQLDEQLKKLSSDPKQRWMVTKDKMDHGPFNARELIERVNIGGFEGADPTMNTDTGDRKPLKEWSEFREFVLAREHQDRLLEEQAARHRARSSERRSSFAVWTLTAGLIAVLLLGVGTFLISRGSGAREAASTELDDLYEHGEVPLGEAGILPDRPNKRRKRRASGSAASEGQNGLSSYEDAMNEALELGDASQGGGESTLSGKQVASVMNKHLNRIYRRCVPAEASLNPSMKSVSVDLAIAGDGRVLGSSVSPGSTAFQSCMSQAIASVRFPSFEAPRMGARYRFKVD